MQSYFDESPTAKVGMNISEYTIIAMIGQCCDDLASIHLAKHDPSGKLIAVKKYNIDKAKEEISLIQKEIILTRQLRHPNILKYHASFVSGPEVCIITPLMAFGSCRDLLNTHFSEGLPESAIALILKDALDALNYVHKKGYIHRALRASHILISASGRALLSGFRYACPLIQHGKWQKQIFSFPSAVRNLNWLSPEVLEQNLQGYNEKSDIYSIGIVICELANGSEPFAGMPTTLMLIEKVRGAAPQLLDCTTVPRDENNELHADSEIMVHSQGNRRFSESLHQMAALCLQREANDRPTAGQMLTHPYLKQGRRGLLLPELLKPAIPLSDRVACNTDELANLEYKRMSELEIYTCDWDF